MSQLDVVYRLVETCSRLPVKDYEHKLLIAHMICLHKKLLPKYSYPEKVTKLSLPATEALAFFIMFRNEDFTDPFVMATIGTITNSIHKQYF